MTCTELALELLSYSGIEDLDPSANENSLLKRGMNARTLNAVATCINGALQEAFSKAPSFISERPMAGVFRPPASIGLTLTQYETGATNVTGFEDWMLGCTVRVDGDEVDNRIVEAPPFDPAAFELVKVSETSEHGSESIVVLHLIGTPDPQEGDILVCQGLEFPIVTISSTFDPDDPETQDYRRSYNIWGDSYVLGDDVNFPVYLKVPAVRRITLLRPYMGGSGAVSGTVYADAIPLPSNVKTVLDPIELPNNHRLCMAGSAEEFRASHGALGYDSSHSRLAYTPGYSVGTTNKEVGDPSIAFVDGHYDGTSAHLPLFLRVNPMPGRTYPVTFRAKLKPPTITPAMIDDGTGGDDPLTTIPVDFVEATVLPIALQRWTRNPHFGGDANQVREINRQYQEALNALENLKPSISRVHGIYVAG